MREFVLMAATAGVGFKVFAQSVTLGDPVDIGSLIGNLGVIGVLVWHLWYYTTRAQPHQLEQFAAEQRASRDSFAAQMEENRKVFAAEMGAQRAMFLAEQKAGREHDERVQAELRNLFMQLGTSFRVAVHDVKDTAQATLNKIEASNAQGRSGDSSTNLTKK